MEWCLSALKGAKHINYFKHTGQAIQSI